MSEIAPLDGLSDAARARVQAIYEEAFPARQRVPFHELLADARSGDELAFVGLEDGRPVGLAFLSELAGLDHLFLEYFAVARDLRGGGRGRWLLEAVGDALGGDGARPPLVLEVEDPDEAQLAEAEVAERERRVRFWEHAGAVVLPVEGYLIPNMDGTGVESMRLMRIAGSAGGDEPRPALELVLALYEQGYGLDGEHPLVQRARRVWG